MTVQTRQIFEEALSLSPIERTELIEMVFDNFSGYKKSNFDQLWAEEAELRINEFERGKHKAVSAKKVFQNIEKLE